MATVENEKETVDPAKIKVSTIFGVSRFGARSRSNNLWPHTTQSIKKPECKPTLTKQLAVN